MKKLLFFTTTLLLFFAFQVDAQQPPQRGPRERMTPEQQATRMVEFINKDVKLTDAQQKELKTWFTQSYKKRGEEFQKNRGNREAMMEMMKKSQTETDAQLKKVLTADQYKNYQEIQKKRMEEMRQRGPRGPRGGGFPRN